MIEDSTLFMVFDNFVLLMNLKYKMCVSAIVNNGWRCFANSERQLIIIG